MARVIDHLKTANLIVLSFFVYISVAAVNDGIMALDEYWVGIVRYIPAQTSDLMSLVSPDDVKSPLQLLPMHALAQLALKLEILSPYWQYRFVLLVLGAISASVLLFALVKFIKNENLQKYEANLLILMMTFYFAGAFGVTRPMFESIAAPWLFLSVVYAQQYDKKGQLSDLLWGVLYGSLAFVLRQQLGLCALVFIILPLVKKQFGHFFLASGIGLLCFVLSGIPDYFIRGKFHYSLLNLTLYNYQHGADYGNQSVLFYPAIIFVIMFVPFFIIKYPPGFIKTNYRQFRSFYWSLLLFLFLHSLFPNKWERFLISVIPIMLVLLFPFLAYLQNNFMKHRWRLTSLYGINFCFFVVAAYFPAQKNLIEMSRYLDRHPEIKKVHRVSETPGWITEAFILNKQFSFVESNENLLSSENWHNCENAFVLGEAQKDNFKELTSKLFLNAEFNVNLIESLSFKLNPQKNLRRVRLYLYSGCSR